MGNPTGNPMGEPSDSKAFQVEGLTEPHNSVGAGALVGQLPTASQAASPASSPTVLPAPGSEDVKASKVVCLHVHIKSACDCHSTCTFLDTIAIVASSFVGTPPLHLPLMVLHVQIQHQASLASL